MDEEKPEWKWRYSMWTGIMYGPIPVGIIFVATVLVGYLIYVALTTN